MDERVRGLLAQSVRVLLTPLVRILLRNGIPFAAFAEFAKKVYVDVAEKEFSVPGRRMTKSRIAVTTGLTRKEVSRLLEIEAIDAKEIVEKYGRATRVVSGWIRDSKYHERSGAPVRLPFESDGGPSFSQLVRDYAGDMPPRAVLDELEQSGVVTVDGDTSNRTVELGERAYLPTASEEECLRILGTDVADLIRTIDHNMLCDPDRRYFQRKVAYDNLPPDCLEELRTLTGQRAQGFLEFLDAWLAKRDRDAVPEESSPDAGDGRKRAMLGIYFYEEDFDPAASIESSGPNDGDPR